MGVKAAVVYDVPRHKTVVLRTQSVSTTERYEVLDTIAAFSQHCESLRGVARSVTEVSALWGGPPYVNYAVVSNRYRTIIIWDETAEDLGVTYDVYRALNRLEKAVAAVSEGLVNRAVDAVSRVYDEAGFALQGDSLTDLIEDAPPPTNGSRIVSSSTFLSRKSSAVEPKKKKSSGLFGRLGSVIKSSKSEKQEVVKHRNTPLSTSLREPSESAALSVANFGSEAGLEDKEGDIELADEVFAWADFGEPLPEGLGDLDWFESLLKGDTATKKRPRAPVLRSGKTHKTPLKIPSPTDLQQQDEILTDSATSKVISDRKASAPAPPLPSPPTVPGVSQQASTTSTPTPPTPATRTPLSSGTPLQSSSSSVPSASGPMQQSRGSNLNSSVIPSPGSLPHSVLSVPQSLGSVAQSPPVPPPSSMNGSQQNVAITASPLIVHAVPPRPGVPSASIVQGSGTPSDAPAPTPQSTVASSQVPVPAPSPASTIPPALRQSDDFDVAGLGGFKDEASVGETKRKEDDDLIRAKMNEFAITMQSGNFRLALQQVIATLRYLAGVNPRRDREIVTCSNYYLAQKLLIRNAALEQELAGVPGGTPIAVQRHIECAILTMFLAELKHLTPRHRVAAMKVAVEKNSIVGNYGMCARWLRQLVEKAPAGKKADFANRLQICVRNGERNSHMPPTSKLCYNSLQVVTGPYGSCNVCGAVFHPMAGGVAVGQVCSVCFVGVVERKK